MADVDSTGFSQATSERDSCDADATGWGHPSGRRRTLSAYGAIKGPFCLPRYDRDNPVWNPVQG
eukprot:6961800-Pyramimonas_sp.AAC.1